MKNEPESPYAQAFTDRKFRTKLVRYAKDAGAEVVERALQLHYAAQHPKTPAWAKRTIYGALGYFVFPLDAIPDLLPGVGYSDDLGALAVAVATVALYITPAVKAQARAKMQDWFG